MRRGALFVFEGLDRSGKSTQSTFLLKSLTNAGHECVLWKFPDRESHLTGSLIDSYLRNRVEMSDFSIHLLFSANRWEKRDEMIRLLNSGATVIVDRYAFSGIAYSSAKKNGPSLKWAKQSDAGLPRPDRVFYLDLGGGRNGAARAQFGEERYEVVAFQARVAEQYRLLQDESWSILNATHSVERLSEEILQLAQKSLERCQSTELGVLWPGHV